MRFSVLTCRTRLGYAKLFTYVLRQAQDDNHWGQPLFFSIHIHKNGFNTL